MKIDISDLNKCAVLAALYNRARPQGMGFLHYTPAPMSMEDASAMVNGGQLDIDYLNGRVMKVDLRGDSFDPWLYDRDNGEGAAQSVIDSLRKSVEVKS